MANLTGIVTFTTNTVISSSDMNSNFSAITTVCNTTDGGYASKTGTEVLTNKTLTAPTINGGTITVPTINGGTITVAPPVGSIIAHYDFNAAVAINTSYFAYCDGSVVSNASSPINGQTLPDLSNRYLVGFGTEGGGDIDSAAWATDAVGNASHQVNLSHYHKYGNFDGGSSIKFYTEANSSLRYVDNSTGAASGSFTRGITGINLSTGDFNTWSSGSATQSIQPRSIRVRWIMRVV